MDGDCSDDQIRLDGKCENRAKMGESCKSSLQCISNSRCISGICGCAKGELPDGNSCKKEVKKPPKKDEICVIMSEEPHFVEEKLVSCVLTNDDCPVGLKCQFSEVASQNVCCGPKNSPKNATEKPTEPPTTQASTTVGAIIVTKKSKPIKVPAQHCPAQMSPYLVNGRAKSCATTSCPYGYQCKFSNTAKDYFCCSKQTKKSNSNRIRGEERNKYLVKKKYFCGFFFQKSTQYSVSTLYSHQSHLTKKFYHHRESNPGRLPTKRASTHLSHCNPLFQKFRIYAEIVDFWVKSE